ncbi:lipopolysaccharide biosynthesis protein [Methylomicrobium lacus]|uniref:lipopolysaccharide biosynthesis protein n=1 Tax=Methylomicrobium lacus TaxID=136992 RepID=UPI00045E5FDD|nr:oligosaccharide flippase family protein [Methylomicrobium lacus]
MKTSGILKAGGVYSIVGIAQSLIWVILLPVHTHFLSAADYGLISLCTAMVTGSATVLEFGFSRAVVQSIFSHRTQEQPWQIELLTPIKFILIIALAIMSATGILAWRGFFEFDRPLAIVITLTVGAAVTLPVIRVYGEALKMQSRLSEYAKLMSVVLAVTLFGNLGFVVGLKLGIVGVLLALAAANWLGAMWAVFALTRKFSHRLDKTELKQALAYGLPLVPHFSIGAFLPAIERSLLAYFAGIQTTGLYAVASSIANLLTIITTSFTTALRPRMFAMLETAQAKDFSLLRKKMYLVTAAFMVIAVIGSLLAEPVITLFAGKNFYDAWPIVPLLLTRQAIYGVYQYVATVYYFIKSGTKRLLSVSFLAVLTLLIVSPWVVPRYGVFGMAAVSVLSACVYLLCASAMAKRLHPMRWPVWRSFLIILLGAAALAGAYLPWYMQETALILPIKAGEIAVLLAVLFAILKTFHRLDKHG